MHEMLDKSIFLDFEMANVVLKWAFWEISGSCTGNGHEVLENTRDVRWMV